MATKCMDQIPPPKATAAIATAILRCMSDFSDRFRVSDSPVNPATNATMIDITTNSAL